MNQPAPQSQPGGNVATYTVSELSGAIKRALEEGFGHVRLRGEISGFRGAHASGHCYFALKDDKAKIEAVIWKMTYGRLKVKPEEGMEVVVQGRVTSYPGSSKYQIVIESLEPAGLGALMALLEERKRRLAAEGLFAEERKKPRPFLPQLVGIITSPTGAVIRDMLHGFAERFPTRVIVWPVRVQGETCAVEVAAAIAGFNAIALGGPIGRPDVLIVARGGGSLEDLWGFNEEIVVRAVAASRIPVISAVGHETDWTLIDLVADARAPTPTKAAEWAVPKFADLADSTEKCGARLTTAARNILRHARTHLKSASRGLPRLEDVIALPRQRFDACEKRLGRALLANARAHHTRYARISARLRPAPILHRIAVCGERAHTQQVRAAQALRNGVAARRRQLEGCSKLLSTLSYQSVLQRGFALVRDAEGRTVRSVAAVAPGDRLDVELRDGHIEAEAQRVRATGSKDPAPAAPAPQPSPGVRRARGRGGSSQGSLF
ncbi:MAG: exodeoxyribonuclease VII large subunit [Hyphomicrobium sp.]|nr:exodeoxyribonuclease VII large subunit [Hyphomicrobium sp.]